MRISDWSSDVCSSDLRPCSRTDGAIVSRWGVARHYASPDVRRVTTAPTLSDRAFAGRDLDDRIDQIGRHTSELQSLMRISYAVFCLKKKKKPKKNSKSAQNANNARVLKHNTIMS